MAKTETAPKTAPKTNPETEKAPKAPKAPRVKRQPNVPSLETFKGVAKTEFEAILNGAKGVTEAFTQAEHVSIPHLREVRRAVIQALNNSIRGRKKDPGTRKREKLMRQIEKAQKALAEMGVE